MTTQFHWADYLIFAASCALTVVVGIAVAIKDNWRKQSSESYLMANRQMNWVMMSLSIFASLTNAVMFVGITSEFYYTGMEFMWMAGGLLLAAIYTMLVTIPMLHNTGYKMTSAYEYLEHRFGISVRTTASLIFFVGNLLYMAVVLYAPSLILAQVTSMDVKWCMFMGGCVCALYTGFGGMKAVVWVDSMQTVIMIIGMLILAIKGTIEAGGIQHTWEVYEKTGRSRSVDLDWRPWNRHTVWNLVILGFIHNAANQGSQQVILQRFMAVKNMRQAQVSMFLATLMYMIFLVLMLVVAVACFATVGGNEPLLTGEIQNPGQIYAYYVTLVMGQVPGLSGLVVAASFAAALSTLSSGQNSLAAVFLEDFVKPAYHRKNDKVIPDKIAGTVSRVSGVMMGGVVIGLGVIISNFDDMVFSLARSLESFVAGPVFVMMACGLFLPFVEKWGCLAGGLVSLGWAFQMYFGSLRFSQKLGWDKAPLYRDNFTQEIIPVTEPNVTPTLYDFSYTWYALLDIGMGVLVAFLVSLVVRYIKYRNLRKIGKTTKFMDISRPKDCLLYTKDDFLIALGVNKCQDQTFEDTVAPSSGGPVGGGEEGLPMIPSDGVVQVQMQELKTVQEDAKADC